MARRYDENKIGQEDTDKIIEVMEKRGWSFYERQLPTFVDCYVIRFERHLWHDIRLSQPISIQRDGPKNTRDDMIIDAANEAKLLYLIFWEPPESHWDQEHGRFKWHSGSLK